MPRWEQAGLGGRSWGSQLGPEEREHIPDAPCLADSTEEEDEAQFEPSDGVPRGLGDGLQGAQATDCLHQVPETACRTVGEAQMGKGGSVGRKGKGIWSCRADFLLGDCRKDRDQTCPFWKGRENLSGKAWGKSVALESSRKTGLLPSMLLHGSCPKPRIVTGHGWDQQTGGVEVASLSWVVPGKSADRSLSHSAPAPRRGPRLLGATAAPRSPCPSSSTPHTSCSRRTASHNTSTTSTGGAALTVGSLHRGVGQVSAMLGDRNMAGMDTDRALQDSSAGSCCVPMLCALECPVLGLGVITVPQGPPAHEPLTPWGRIGFVTIPSSPNRAKTTGHWSVPGDEHAFPVLVLLPPRSLQQENV